MSKEYADLSPVVEAIAQLRRTGGSRRSGGDAGRCRRSIRRCARLARDELFALRQRLPDLQHQHPTAAAAQGFGRREERHPRGPCRHRRRGGGAVRGRTVPHVPALCRTAPLEVRGAVDQRNRAWRLQGGDGDDLRPGRVRPAEVRIGRPPGSTGAGDRGQRAHPHLGRDGGGAAGGRGGRRPDRGEGHPHRRLPVERAGRPVGQHHRQRRAHHPSADRASSSPSRTRSRSTRTGRRR